MTAVGEGLAANLASEASKGVFFLAKRHAGYCFHFRKYVTEFQTELKNLESTRNDALGRERRAKDNNEVIGEIGRTWLEGAEVLLSDAEELKKKIEEQSMCVIEWCPNCIHRYRLGRKAAKKTPELTKHNADFKSDNFSHPAPRLGMEFHAPINFVDLDSRKTAYGQLWEALHDDQKLRVGVYAMGGSGKTTLVKELGYKAEEKQLFEKVVFVVVSNPPDVRRIQENTASQLGLKFEYNQESDRAKELWSRLTNGEKILIILDDVWQKLDFKAIGIPFEDKHKGCRVLLTTRSVGVCTSMDCQCKIELSLLKEEDSWKLFQRYANISNDPSIPLDVAKEIASACKGLPVAIAAVASTLNNEPREWKSALSTLKDAKPVTGIDEHLTEIYNCLRLSYDNLKSKEVQELFLLCSFFPEDYRIPMEDLTRYAIGLGLFEYDGSYEKMRDKVVKAIKILMNSCLLLNADKEKLPFSYKGECVKMHDLVREAAQWIANKKIKEIMGSKIDKDALDNARYLWFHMTKGLPNQLNCPRLEILMISVETEDSLSFFFEEKEAFFRGLDNLCVLILERKYAWGPMFSFKLPQSIQVLKSLRILRLEGGTSRDISVVGSLKSLESLELCHCKIDELPSGMVELKNLRFLDLSDCRIQQNPFEVIGRFTQLEELYYFAGLYYFDELSWKVDGENISDFFGENCQLTKLIRYRIQIGRIFHNLNNYLILRGLCIDRFHPSTSNATIKNLVRRAEYLCLKEIKGGYKNIVPDVVRAVGGKIEFIRLHLDSCNDIECLIDATNASMLPELVELQVDGMKNLKELWHGTPPSGFLEKLEKLDVLYCPQLRSILFVGNLNLRSLKVVKVRSCSMLTSLFTLSVALSLVLLEELQINDCNGLEYIIADEREWEKDDYDHKISSGSIFPKLKSVIISDCDSLEFIFPVWLAGRLVLLEQIEISGTAKLKHIFGQYQDEVTPLHQNDKEIILPSLQRIELEEIPNFNSIFAIYCHSKDCPQVEATDLEATTPMELHPSQNQATTWYTSTVQCLSRQLGNLCHIRDCAQVKATALDATTSTELHASQNRDTRLLPHVSAVQYCLSRRLLNLCHIKEMDLVSLPTTVVSLFTRSTAQKMLLKKLTIRRCEGLKHIITDGDEVDFDHKDYVSIFPELQDLRVYGCNLLEYIFPACFAQGLAKLKSLDIQDALELKYVFGQCHHNDHLSHHNENVIHVELPALEDLQLRSLPKIVGMCHRTYHPTWPCLKQLDLMECPQLPTKSIIDFMICSDAREPDCITTKAILRHDNMLNMEELCLESYGIEGIFLMEGLLMNGQQDPLTSRLKELQLGNLPELRYICKGPQQCLSFQNLSDLEVSGCGKLSCIFSVSVLRSLPQLNELTIENCNELEQIIEDEEEDQVLLKHYSHNVCFPNMRSITIQQCNKLKCLFSISQSNEFPKLTTLTIKEASQLEEVFRWRLGETQDRENTVLPNLSNLTLIKLPCLTNVCQGFKLQTNLRLRVEGCPKLPPEYRNGEEEEISEEETSEEEIREEEISEEEIIEEETSEKEISEEETSEEDDTRLLTVTPPGSAKINAIQTAEGVPIGDARKELSASATQYHVTPIEETKGKEVVIEQFTTFVESRDADPQTSTNQAINMNENIHGSSDNPLAVPPSRDFTSGNSEKQSVQEDPKSVKAIRVTMSTDSKQGKNVLEPAVISIQKASPQEFEGKESSNETIMTDQQRVKRSVREREKEIVQKSSASEKPGMVTSSTELEQGRPSPSTLAFPLQKNTSHELVDEQLLSVPILMEQQNAHAETQITTEIPRRIANTASNENIEGKVQQDVQESSISEEAIIVTPPIDSEPQKSSAGSLGIPILKAFPQCVTESVEGGAISEKSEIVTSLTYSEPISMPQESVWEESRNETMMMDKQSVDRSVEDFHTSEKDKIATSSTDSKPGSSFPVSFVTPLHETSPQSIIKETAKEIVQKCPMPAKPALATSSTESELRRPSPSTLLGEIIVGQTETYASSDTKANPINLKDFEEDDLLKIFQTIKERANVKESIPFVSAFPEELSTLDDDLTAKAFNYLEASLKSPLKDIASSESNKLCLENALSVLSHCSSEDGALLARVKATIDSLHQNLPSILSSFKKATATIDKFTALEKNEKSIKEELPQREKAAITLVSDISKTAKSMSKAQQKEAGLKEQISQLQLELESTEKEINNCEVNLSSLQGRKKKLLADAVEFQKEFEVVTEDKSQMWEDQRKAQQELIKVNYEWYALCSQFEQDCTAARNPPQV